MNDYIDTYLVSADAAALAGFCAQFRNVLGLVPGRAAVEAGTDSAGNATAAIPAAGDPTLTYACVRATFAVPLPDGISAVEEAVGRAVVNGWAA